MIANRRHDNHREHLNRFVVRCGSDLIDTIIPLSETHQLHSAKQRDFEKFSRCVELIEQRSAPDPCGLADIAEITQTMNREKPRHDLIRILRDHTPEVQDTGS